MPTKQQRNNSKANSNSNANAKATTSKQSNSNAAQAEAEAKAQAEAEAEAQQQQQPEAREINAECRALLTAALSAYRDDRAVNRFGGVMAKAIPLSGWLKAKHEDSKGNPVDADKRFLGLFGESDSEAYGDDGSFIVQPDTLASVYRAPSVLALLIVSILEIRGSKAEKSAAVRMLRDMLYRAVEQSDDACMYSAQDVAKALRCR